MGNVEKDEKARNEDLLRARREKLLKWKNQKAKQDAIKAAAAPKEDTQAQYKVVDDSVLSNRRDKLAAWKKKKRVQAETAATVEPVKVKKAKKNKKKRFTFGDEEDTESNNKEGIVLFKPPSMVKGKLEDKIDAIPKNIVATETTDALDDFMAKLDKQGDKQDNNEISIANNDVLDGIDNVGVDDMAIGEDDTDEKQTAQYKKIAKMNQLKKVTEIKYDKSNLEPFQKQFYFEPEEVKNMTPEQVKDLRLNLDNITVKGKGCPNPVERWSQLGLSTSVMNMVTQNLKFKQLTPIQAQALPAIMSGRDVIGISKTGSGKTITYLLPLIRHIKAQRDLVPGETGPMGLIMAPTRELAQQIYEETLRFIAKDNDLSCVCCTGGSELKEQIRILKKGVKILVATPGRFIDLLTLNTGNLVNTRRITMVVIDEADRLFDMGFEPQITQIMKSIRPDKQCVLFSATFPNKLRNFAMRVLHKPLSITVNSANMVNKNIEQSFVVCDSSTEKFGELIRIIADQLNRIPPESQEQNSDEIPDEKTIIFVSSQQICDFLEKQLTNHGIQLFSIHAGKQYQERINNLEAFKKTKNSILLCTEVMSRGLNVPEVSLVIIYNGIKTFAQYVHTTGRTARGVNHGKAVSILDSSEIAAAYILTKAMHEQLDQQSVDQLLKLKAMSKEFEDGMKNGKYVLSTGFGGKGLDNLDSKREQQEIKERKQYENVSGEVTTTKKQTSRETDETPSEETTEDDITIPKLEYKIIEEKDTSGVVLFSARVNINDLPQLVRWETSKNTTLSFVKNETGCSITNKGRYYPAGDGPKTEKDPPKLYLLIEGKEEKDIILGITLLEEKVKEGMKKVEYQTIKSHKF